MLRIMKNNMEKINTAVCAGLILVGLLTTAGCTEDLPGLQPGSQSDIAGEVHITLSMENPREVEVRALDQVDPNVMNNIWAIQLDASGNVINDDNGDPLISYFSGSDITASAAGNDGATGYSILLTVDEQAAEIRFVANTSNDRTFSDVRNAADIEACQLASIHPENGESTFITQDNAFPMSGCWKRGVESYDIYNIKMYRAMAHVSLNIGKDLPDGEDFVLDSVTVYGVAPQLYYYRDPDVLLSIPQDAASAYPAIESTMEYQPVLYTDQPLSEIWPDVQYLTDRGGETRDGLHLDGNVELNWYVPENARGQNMAVTSQYEKTEANAPDLYCTYIEIRGYYLANGLVDAVRYRIYLGENNSTDFNIIRNTDYLVTATIRGKERIDFRINDVQPENYLDYTDNNTPWFIISDDPNASDVAWDNLNNCPAGWRVMTQKDAMLMWIYRDPNEQWQQYYWTNNASFDAGGSVTGRWAVQMNAGEVSFILEGGRNYNLRCVKDV